MNRTYSISELAEEFDVTTRTLRFYEDKGILSPQRKGTVRVYGERDKVRLRLALRGKRLGFSLDDCREIIEMYDPIAGNKLRQLKRLQDKIREHRQVLLSKRDDIAFAVERNFGVAEQQLNSLKTRWRSLDQGRGGDARLVLPAALSSAAIASLAAAIAITLIGPVRRWRIPVRRVMRLVAAFGRLVD